MASKPILCSQHGAMFGMDGRISAVLFAVIGTIMGIFGITKLTTAQQTAVIKELMAIEDALQLMQSNFGVFMEEVVNGGSDGEADFEMLYDQSQVVSNYRRYWSGPYITDETRTHRNYGVYTISYGQANRTSSCTASNECYVWLELTLVPEGIWNKVNSYYDENLGSALETSPSSEGRVHGSSVSSGTRTLYLRTIKRPE